MSDEPKQPDEQPGSKKEQARPSEGASECELPSPFGNQPSAMSEGNVTTGPPHEGEEVELDAENTKARKHDFREDSAARTGDANNDLSDPFSPDYASPAEKLLDLLALEGHENSLAGGFPRAEGPDADEMDERIDLIRSTRTREINVCLFKFIEPSFELSFAKEIRSGEKFHRVPA